MPGFGHLTAVNKAEVPSAREVRESAAMVVVGRGGMVARGVLHLLVGLLAVELVRGRPTEAPGTQGAIARLARQPFGRALVALIALGFLSYALWRAAQAVVGRDDETPVWKRLSLAARSALYVGFAALAGRAVLRGSGTKGDASGGSDRKGQAAATVLDWPGGRFLVAGVGLAVIGIGVYNGYRAATAKFQEHLEQAKMPESVRRLTLALGVAGHGGRGLAYGVAGALLVLGGMHHDPQSGTGVDRALLQLAGTTIGPILLTVIAAGLIAHGLYQLLEARYRDAAA